MTRSFFALAVLLAACTTDTAPQPDEIGSSTGSLLGNQATRRQVSGDVYHYEFLLDVGDTPNAKIRVHRVVRERAPWIPRRSKDALMLTHGDFATSTQNFVPVHADPLLPEGLAPWLAARGIDVWMFDRRGVLAPTGPDADTSDFGQMSLAQGLGDLRTALAFARGIRLVTDASLAQLTLGGFSRGGVFTYAYASDEALREPWQRHVKGIVPIDVFASTDDPDTRAYYCDVLALPGYEWVAQGFVDSDNTFAIFTGDGFLHDPTGPHPYLPRYTNTDIFFWLAGQTWDGLFSPNGWYHLMAPVLDENGLPVDLRYTSVETTARWFAAAPYHSSYLEAVDTDMLVCGASPQPIDFQLSRITVPVFLLGAAGGYGVAALDSTSKVGSSDVTSHIVSLLPPEQVAEDFGHGDLLFSPLAPELAWQPLLDWLRAH